MTATLILWMRSDGDSEGERMVSAAKTANLLDHIEKALPIEPIGRIIVVTDSASLAAQLRDHPVILEMKPNLAFAPFGETLRSVIERHAVQALLYMGAGSGVFLESHDMTGMVEAVLSSPELLLVNNFYSTDFAAIGGAINRHILSRCRKDNQIGWVMAREASVRTCVLPSSLATRFDIDTPADLIILKACTVRSRHLSEALARFPIDVSPVSRVMEVLVHRDGEAVVMGRIPPETAAFFDQETACHLRVYIEERGMEAREEERGIWSLAGLCIDGLGIRRFFQTLSTHASAAIIDSRVLYRHLRLRPSRPDRFFSDLFRPGAIKDPVVRQFTREALGSPVPCILGGHTVVSGGLYALAESAWKHTAVPLKRDVEVFRETSQRTKAGQKETGRVAHKERSNGYSRVC